MACVAIQKTALQGLLNQIVAANRRGIDAANSGRYRALLDDAQNPITGVRSIWDLLESLNEALSLIVGNYVISALALASSEVNGLRAGASELRRINTDLAALRKPCPNEGEQAAGLICFSEGILDAFADQLAEAADVFEEVAGSPVWSENAGATPASIGRFFLGWLVLNTYTSERDGLRSVCAQLGVSSASLLKKGEDCSDRVKPPGDDEDDEGEDCTELIEALKELAQALKISDEIAAKLDRVLAAVGSEDFPVTVPANFTDHSAGTMQRNSIPQLLTWHAAQMDAVLGKFPIEIKVQDTELDQPGDQSKTITVPNLAEGVAEILGLAITIETEADLAINATLRTAMEVASSKQALTRTLYCSQAICDYMGFPTKRRTVETPYAVDPTKQRMAEILQNSKQKTIVECFDDGKGGINNMQRILAELLTAAQIVRGVFGTGISKDNPEKAIKDLLRKDEGDGSDFSAWIEQAEYGHTARPGAEDPTHPYGKQPSRRPRIKELGSGDAKEDKE